MISGVLMANAYNNVHNLIICNSYPSPIINNVAKTQNLNISLIPDTLENSD